MNVFISLDTTAISLGADKVATLLQDKISQNLAQCKIIRNGSLGLFWLEPLIVVEKNNEKIAYGPVNTDNFDQFFDEVFQNGAKSDLCLGNLEQSQFLSLQTRITFKKCGMIDPFSISDYQSLGGFVGLKNALQMQPQAIVDAIKKSGLRGRGGAGFPTGIKWQTVLDQDQPQKYIVCNADEGDSGTFADRMIMEGDPFLLLEGMMIAGLAVKADTGYIYLRSEYPQAEKIIKQAIQVLKDNNYLGNNILSSGFNFNIHLRMGAGAYICGEETSLLESLEGKRGTIRYKPPLPAIEGLFSRPTALNNVLSFTAVANILETGAEKYESYGIGRSKGTMPIQLAGNIKHGGLFEVPFGLTLRKIIEEIGGGTKSGLPIKAIQIGGPLGAFFPVSKLDTIFGYEELAEAGGMLGHGGIVVFDDSMNLARIALNAMQFCAVESCGKCTPCRIGSVRGVELLEKIIVGKENLSKNLDKLRELCQLMKDASLCALGGLMYLPVVSALDCFPEDFSPSNNN